MAIGRRKKHLESETQGTIVGLCDLGNKRYRITLDGPHKGKRFNAADERLAIQKFYSIVGKGSTVTIPVATVTVDELIDEGPSHKRDAFAQSISSVVDEQGNITFNQDVKEEAMWAWCRERILEDQVNAAKRLGLPGIATLDFSATPKALITIDAVIEAYEKQSPSSTKAKREAVAAMERLKKNAAAETLHDLTIEKLTAFRDSLTGMSGGTQQAYFGRIKTILAFAQKIGMDPTQIRSALDRCKVLWTTAPLAPMKPHPISRAHFHMLLAAADTTWRARLLLALNACLYIADLRELKWSEVDLEAGTLIAIRGKTRIPRVAMLWPETVAALKLLPRRGGPYLFTSSHGTNFNRNTMGNDFSELRKAAKVPDTVKFADIRDGSFTAAMQAHSDPRWAKVLAGHSSGMEDHYVLRDPAKVKPACDAVLNSYGPFPEVKA